MQPRLVEAPLGEFRPATLTEVTAVIKKSPNKQSELDPMPTLLLKDMCSVIAPVITFINVKNFLGSLTTVVRAQNDTSKTANVTYTIFDRTSLV